MTIGLRLLASLIDHEKGLEQYVRLRLEPELFQSEAEVETFALVGKHVKKYGKLPSRSTCKEQGIVALPGKQPEPPLYYFDKVKERYVFLRLKTMLKGVEGDLNDDKTHGALDRMVDTMSLCQMFVNRDRLVDVAKDGYSMVRADYQQKLTPGAAHGLTLGWPTFDNMTAGLGPGDLISLVGRPGAGKTYLMLHAANHAWRNGRPPLFISMEMKPILIMQRILAMLTTLPITALKKAALTHQQLAALKERFHALTEGNGAPYWLVDGGLTATVDDVIVLSRQLKPGVVFIDGAYLLRASYSKMQRWERITENTERVKSELAEALDIPVVQSFQFNRQVKKFAKSGTVDLGDIAGADAIGQLSSVVMAMLQEDSVETLITRTVEILKGRSGEQGKFSINWCFDTGPGYMNFGEVLPPGGDLNYTGGDPDDTGVVHDPYVDT